MKIGLNRAGDAIKGCTSMRLIKIHGVVFTDAKGAPIDDSVGCALVDIHLVESFTDCDISAYNLALSGKFSIGLVIAERETGYNSMKHPNIDFLKFLKQSRRQPYCCE